MKELCHVPTVPEMRKWVKEYVFHVHHVESMEWLSEEQWSEMIENCREWHRKGWPCMCAGEVLRFM